MVTLLEELNAGTHFPPAMKQAVLGHMCHCDDRDKFPHLLPAGTIVAHKTGSTARVRNDAGNVFFPD